MPLLLLGGGLGQQPGLASATDGAAFVASPSVDGSPTTARVNFYAVQTMVGLSVAFTDAAGASVDPSEVVLTVTQPDQTQTNPVVTREGVGSYAANVVVSEVGVWQYSWQGSGAVVANSGTGLLCGF